MSYKAFFLDSISKKRSGFFAIFRSLLWLVSLGFYVGITSRKLLYRLKVFSSYRPKAYTISIGNLVAGGTGKTPATIFLAKLLQNTHHNLAIVVRPYKAQAHKLPFLVKESSDATDSGDEALVIKHSLNDVSVVAGEKKDAARMADQFASCIIVDDGFQHLALKRDLDIVMIDSENPFGYGYLLPRGLLREPPRGLKRADLIMINCKTSCMDTTALEQRLKAYTNAPIVCVGYKTSGFYDVQGGMLEQKKAKVGLFCAIAKPHQFFHTISKMGYEIVSTISLDDHMPFSQDQLEQFAQASKALGAKYLLCTQKDAVKLQKSNYPLDIYWLKIDLVFLKGSEHLDQLVSRLTSS